MDTTVEIANKVGAAEIASRIVEDLKDENEMYRKMVMDCIEKVCVYVRTCMSVRVRVCVCVAVALKMSIFLIVGCFVFEFSPC